MAYLQEMELKCVGSGCGKPAKVRLIDRWNGNRGQYCRTCGEKALKRQKESEKE